ncbi:DUF4129 domain-containing protein [Micromonospora costi]|uniref:DUF4129 domain-containing protein n=1 Tax=Micromonospora costi TaxID=1530042 RepID=A0A3B0ADE4_9ACTN|nr:DUF4129 domain-containing protein [Micromonospora costi]RKN58341.1 DUF4129 domain-containing protein [Micromonospora costi]
MTEGARRATPYAPDAQPGAGPVRRWWPVAAVILLLAGAGVAAAHSSIGASRIPPSENVPWVPEYTAPTPSPIEPREPNQARLPELPEWVVTVALILLGLVVLAVLGYLAWVLIRGALRRTTRALPQQRRARRTTAGTAEEVMAAVDAGLSELDDRDADPRVVVIACWVRLEEAAAAAGVPRLPGDTPTDLVTRLLRGDPSAGVPAIVSADVLAEFAHVYREARYATRPVDERTRDQARAALRRLRGELTATTAGGEAEA